MTSDKFASLWQGLPRLLCWQLSLIIDSGAFDPPFEAVSSYTGTPSEICEQATPADGTGTDGQYDSAPDTILEDGVDYQAIFCTSAGAVHVDLYEDVPSIALSF